MIQAEEKPRAEAGGAVRLPLTEAQSGLWAAQRLEPANPIYNTGAYVEIAGPLDRAAFIRALEQVVAEAEALCVRVEPAGDGDGDVAVQIPDATRRAPIELVDLSAASDPMASALAAVHRDMAAPLDPARDCLAREVLFALGPERHVWYQRIHHLVVDGFGVALIDARVAELYAAHVGAGEAGPSFAPFAPVLAEDAGYRHADRRRVDGEFWHAAFADRPEVPAMAPGMPITGHVYHRAAGRLPAGTAAALQAFARTHRMPWPDLVVAIAGAYIRRHAGGEEAVVGVPSMNRLGSASARVPAMVMNVLPIRVEGGEDRPLAEFAGPVLRRLASARRHGRYRSEVLRRELGLIGGRKRLHGPLVNVLPFERPLSLPGLETRRTVLGTGAVDDITFTLRADPAGREISIEIDANPALYCAAATEAHRDRFMHFLGAALEAEKLSDVPTLTPAEAEHWVHAVNRTDHEVARTTLAALIEQRMRETPDAPALEADGAVLSYRELDARTSAFAAALARRGVGRGAIVAVALPRSADLVVSLLAIVRAGAAYLPLDIEHPPARIARILAGARPVLALADPATRAILPEDVPILDPATLAGEPAGSCATVPPDPDGPAYVIYTSGSTGEPKGVVVAHDAIVNRLEWMRAHYDVRPGDRILQKTPATFDVSVWEFFLPFLSGATLVVAPRGAHRDPRAIVDLIRERGITIAHFVPSMLAAFLAEPAAAGIEMRAVFASGEELTAALRDRFHATIRAELHNLYGPTEAAVDVTYWPAGPDDRSQPVPIGMPVWNTVMYVLDGAMRPVPPGVAGDLYIGGRQLAREYLGRPDLTAERFLADPFRPGGRIYRTGDIAAWRTDGALVYLGRSDNQVKLRGQRLELGEIEAVVAQAPGVAQAAILAREDRPGDLRLVAYVAPADVDAAAVTAHAAARLPDYMVPSAVIALDSLPVTANGKLDRARLPAPAFAPIAGRPAESETERRLAGLFREVLALDALPGAEDDFFALGGHSLLAAELMLAIRRDWRCEIGLGALFEHTRIDRLAAFLDRLGDEGRTGYEGLGSPIVLFSGGAAQPPLFCVHPAGGISWCYKGLGRALGRRTIGLQAAALDPDRSPPASLEEMAADYIEEIRALGTAAPVHLLGWSVGGIVAQEMAAQLGAAGVGVLAMLDSYPTDCWRAEPEPPEGAALKALLHAAGYDPNALPDLEMTREGVVAFLRQSGHPLGLLDARALSGVMRTVDANNHLVRGHYHKRYTGEVLHFRAALDHAGTSLRPALWQPYAGRVTVHDVPALHPHLVTAESVAVIAPVLAAALDASEQAR